MTIAQAQDYKTLLTQKTETYSKQEQENLAITYMQHLLDRITEGQINMDPKGAQTITQLINALPEKTPGKRLSYKRKTLNLVSTLKNHIKQQYQLVSRNHYKNQGVALGLTMGMPFGLLIGTLMHSNIALGLPIGSSLGLLVGLLIGTRKDQQAAHEGRVL